MGNTAGDGGGFHQLSGDATFTNCTFSGNAASNRGGAMHVATGTVTLLNSTLSRNAATSNGYGIYDATNGTVVITNCILWDSASSEIHDEGGVGVTARYSNIRGGWTGDGVIGDGVGDDPSFADAIGGDLHLQAGSPCIDAADGDEAPATDKEGTTRRDDPATPDVGIGTVSAVTWADMGAFEYCPPTPPPPPADDDDDEDCGAGTASAAWMVVFAAAAAALGRRRQRPHR
jgi:hypothetical protein